jgi:hypothetical protein
VLLACKSQPVDHATATSATALAASSSSTVAPRAASEVLVAFDDLPGAIAIAGDEIYYGDGSSLRAISIARRGARRLATTSAPIASIVLHGDDIYFATTKNLERMSTSGAKRTQLETFERLAPTIVATDAGLVYAVCCGEPSKLVVRGWDGARRTLHEWTGDGELHVAVDGANLYVANEGEGRIERLVGGKLETVASNEHGPRTLLVDARDVYWTTPDGGGSVRRAAKTGALRPETITGGLKLVAQDDAWIYVTTGDSLRRRHKTSGVTEDLMHAPSIAAVTIVDEHTAYVVVGREPNVPGQIVRLSM